MTRKNKSILVLFILIVAIIAYALFLPRKKDVLQNDIDHLAPVSEPLLSQPTGKNLN